MHRGRSLCSWLMCCNSTVQRVWFYLHFFRMYGCIAVCKRASTHLAINQDQNPERRVLAHYLVSAVLLPIDLCMHVRYTFD